jgi:hypothetical protein
MFISYENDEIRECCLLLSDTRSYSHFAIDEIKIIRSIIADLKSAPQLSDAPVKYNYDKESEVIEINYGFIKIVCKAVTTLLKPTADKVQRVKIVNIINVAFEENIAGKGKIN